jgi:hypothetical protein
MGFLNAIGGFLGGLLGIGGDTDQTDINAQLQAQIDADNKRDKIQGIVSWLGLIVGGIALIMVFRKK